LDVETSIDGHRNEQERVNIEHREIQYSYTQGMYSFLQRKGIYNAIFTGKSMSTCRRGHERTDLTLYFDTKGKRCRVCMQAVRRRYYLKHRERILAKMEQQREAKVNG
jgi:hypothetical protein